MWWFVAPKIVFGDDALESLEDLGYKRVLIVTDEILHTLGYVDEVLKYLKAENVEIFDQVEPEPSLETTKKAVEVAREFQPDCIIAIGGGSVMDVAKATRILYEIDIDPEQVTPFVNLREFGYQKKAELITIPTTSGTGSETTWAMVITDVKRRQKLLMANREAVPDMAVVDARFVVRMPPSITASSGMDALCHAIEAYISPWGNEFTEPLALKAAETVLANIAKSFEGEEEARKKMHVAATIAGLAFSNSQVGVIHAMGHSFGAVFKIPHGIAVGLFLPYVLEYYLNSDESIGKVRELSRKLGFDDGRGLIAEVVNLMDSIKLPTKAMELINEKEFQENLDILVRHAMEDSSTVTSPRIPDEAEYRKLFECAFYGRRVDF
jgi:alcohol dehydrogenase class IV